MNATSSNAGTPGANGGHSARIMVVDDDVRLRDLLRRYLTEQGFQVVTAESAPAMNKLWLRERCPAKTACRSAAACAVPATRPRSSC